MFFLSSLDRFRWYDKFRSINDFLSFFCQFRLIDEFLSKFDKLSFFIKIRLIIDSVSNFDQLAIFSQISTNNRLRVEFWPMIGFLSKYWPIIDFNQGSTNYCFSCIRLIIDSLSNFDKLTSFSRILINYWFYVKFWWVFVKIRPIIDFNQVLIYRTL